MGLVLVLDNRLLEALSNLYDTALTNSDMFRRAVRWIASVIELYQISKLSTEH